MHVVGLVQQVIERASSVSAVGGGGAEAALLALADAAAELVHAPVTIEDAASRVVAYSSRQDVTDTTRVSTIVGRRVPAATVAALRSRGVFRRLARSGRPFLVPPGRGLETARYVVPVRSGGEWLGSVWAVVDREPHQDVVAELQRTASLIAVHLLRARAMADLTRSLGAERLRTLLTDGAPASGDGLTWLPDGPWRAVALGPGGESARSERPSGTASVTGSAGRHPLMPGTARSDGAAAGPAEDVDVSLDAWESRFRRARWSQPLLTDLGGHPFAVVSAEPAPAGRAARPGSWDWLVELVRNDTTGGDVESTGGGLGSWVAGGRVARTVGDLPTSARGASEVAALVQQGSVRGAAATVEEQWARLTVVHAVAAVEVVGPVAVLADHDRVHHSDYLASLGSWLDYSGQPKEAARSLGVHVNTLRHRMVRMSEVVAMDLDDPLVRLALRLQLMASDSARL